MSINDTDGINTEKLSLDEGIRLLAQIRDRLFRLDADLAQAEMAFKIEMAPLINEIARLKEQDEMVYTALREKAVQAFMETGDKNPHSAITIKRRALKSYDMDKAIQAAITAGRADLLQPQKSKMNDAIYGGELDVEFAEDTQWEATVQKKLGEFLFDEGNSGGG